MGHCGACPNVFNSLQVYALRSCTAALSDNFLWYLYHGDSPQWFGFIANPDHTSPHIVQMAKGLLYVLARFKTQ